MRYKLCVISNIWEKMLESFIAGAGGKWDLWGSEYLGGSVLGLAEMEFIFP